MRECRVGYVIAKVGTIASVLLLCRRQNVGRPISSMPQMAWRARRASSTSPLSPLTTGSHSGQPLATGVEGSH